MLFTRSLKRDRPTAPVAGLGLEKAKDVVANVLTDGIMLDSEIGSRA
jgi:hypothetical protein